MMDEIDTDDQGLERSVSQDRRDLQRQHSKEAREHKVKDLLETGAPLRRADLSAPDVLRLRSPGGVLLEVTEVLLTAI